MKQASNYSKNFILSTVYLRKTCLKQKIFWALTGLDTIECCHYIYKTNAVYWSKQLELFLTIKQVLIDLPFVRSQHCIWLTYQVVKTQILLATYHFYFPRDLGTVARNIQLKYVNMLDWCPNSRLISDTERWSVLSLFYSLRVEHEERIGIAQSYLRRTAFLSGGSIRSVEKIVSGWQNLIK